MVAINQVAAPATILLGLASQALALPVATTQQIAESGLLERAVDSELAERDLETRFLKKILKGAAKVGKGLLGFRDVEERDIEELDERDLAELVQRYFDDAEVEERDVEEELDTRDNELAERDLEVRFLKKLLKGAAKVGKGLLGFRDLEERDYETLDERDIDELVARFYDESELDTRDVSELNERDLEARFFKKILGGVAKVGKGLLGFRDLAERDIDVEEFAARAFDEDSELDTRDESELSERDLETRFLKKIFKGAAKVGGALLGFRDLEARDVEELDSRDVAEMIERFVEGDLEERDYEELDERDFEEELAERDYEAEIEARDLEARFLKKILKGAAKVGGALIGFRDLEARDIDDLVTRTLDETEMEVREDTEELSKRALAMFYRDISERDDDLSERDLVTIAARYFDEDLE